MEAWAEEIVKFLNFRLVVGSDFLTYIYNGEYN